MCGPPVTATMVHMSAPNSSPPSFSGQLTQLWRTRPVRLPHRGPVAGVAAGIGHRYDVDPVLVRVAFVVTTIFGGTGIVAYLACWLLLPRAGDQVSAGESLLGRGHSSDSGTKAVVLAVALVIAATTIGPIGVGFGASGVIGLALLFGGLWLLFQRRPEPPAAIPGTDPWAGLAAPTPGFPAPGFPAPGFPAPGFPAPDATVAGGHLPGVFTTLPKTYQPAPPQADAPAPLRADTPEQPDVVTADVSATVRPPAWDPLGVAPFAWDLPEPTPPPTPPPVSSPRPRSRLTSVVLGLAILASVAAWAIGTATDGDWMTPGRIAAVGLAVIGLGLVVGAFLRRGHGLLVVTGPLIGFVVLASLVGPVDWSNQNVGTQTWTPTTAAQIEPEYTGRFGDFTLDLSRVPLTEDTTVDVDLKMGAFTVLVPENLDVRNTCSMVFGEARCLPDGVDGGADGVGGPVLTVNVDGAFGDVQVRRA